MHLIYLRWLYRALLVAFVLGAPMVIVVALIAIPRGPRMRQQARLKPYENSEFYKDHRSVRHPPMGTIARGERVEDAAFYWGRHTLPPVGTKSEPSTRLTPLTAQTKQDKKASRDAIDEIYVERIPIPLTSNTLERGRERFDIFCAPCHGAAGDGQGVITHHDFPSPPTFHSPPLREAPAGYIFDVITQGYGMMYSYADRLNPADRWAVVAYIRALQLSQHAPADKLSPIDIRNLREAK